MSRHADLVMRAKLGVQRAAQLVQEAETRLAKVCPAVDPRTSELGAQDLQPYLLENNRIKNLHA